MADLPAAATVSDRLMSLPQASAVAVRLSTAQYFDIIQGILDLFAKKRELDVIYITSTVPSASLIGALEALEIPMTHIWFVDCISQVMFSSERHPHTIVVESPTMLENIMLKVEFLLRKSPERKALVVLDSINSLAIHNNTKILSEFLHILVNNLRAREAYTVIFSVREYESDDVRNMLVLITEETLDFPEEDEGERIPAQ